MKKITSLPKPILIIIILLAITISSCGNNGSLGQFADKLPSSAPTLSQPSVPTSAFTSIPTATARETSKATASKTSTSTAPETSTATGSKTSTATATETSTATATETSISTATNTSTSTTLVTLTTGDIQIARIFYDGVVNTCEPDEFVEIKNFDTNPIQLLNWTLRDLAEHVYTFSSFVIAPNQTCRIYTNETHADFCSFNYRSSQGIWNNSGDTAYLRDSSGNLIDEYRYK